MRCPAVLQCEAQFALARVVGPALGRWDEARRAHESARAIWGRVASEAWVSRHIVEPGDYQLTGGRT